MNWAIHGFFFVKYDFDINYIEYEKNFCIPTTNEHKFVNCEYDSCNNRI